MPSSDVTIVDGSLDFSGGVDSIKTTTIASQAHPQGLQRNQLAWLINATVRDGGVNQRWAWKLRGTIRAGGALYQGGFMYRPLSELPYLILSVGGQIYEVDVDNPSAPINLSTTFGLSNPTDIDYGYMEQGEEFLVIQAGDYGRSGQPVIPGTTDANGNYLPLFWDGATLRRSVGITNPAVAPGTNGINEIPAALSMDYYMGRLWYAQGRHYSAGDIVGGPSGTLAYGFRDAILNVTENPLVLGGDGFTVPTTDGNIRALKHSAAIDAALGQGRLFIFTSRAVYALYVPVSRQDWINTGNQAVQEIPGTTKVNYPLQTIVQLVNGSVNDRSIVPVNGDLYYQSLDPNIRSLLQAVRYFQQPGNKNISANENRILQFNNRGLLRFASGITYDNRMIQTQLPRQTSDGVVHDGLAPIDFMPASSLGEDRAPNWEGVWQGLPILQLFTGNFGGLERSFAVVRSEIDGSFQLWEFTPGEKFENIDSRVLWQMETPAYTWGREFDLKRLVSGELWFDRIFGTVEFRVEWRADGETCWHLWTEWQKCTPRSSAEVCVEPELYPTQEFGPCYAQTMTLPKPPKYCAQSQRPADLGYQFQLRITVRGWARLRGLLVHANLVDRKLYANLIC